MNRVLLQAKDIVRSFGGVRALDGASFELREDEVHALVGENGAGKSTLIKIMTGAVAAESGSLEVMGQEVAHNSPRLSRQLGIAPIYQQPALFPHLTVAENIALALETGGMWRKLDWRRRRKRARDLLDEAGTTLDPDRLAGALSMPEQQIVEIAKAMGADARILIMDEPTASLTDLEVERLFATIARLRERGAGMIYISHRLEEISSIADRITVLRDGRTIATRSREDFTREELIRLMVGRELSAESPQRQNATGDVVLEVRRKNFSLQLRSGEILGLAGLVGSGRTGLAETIFGLRPAAVGEIWLRGAPVRIQSPADAIRHEIAYVPEDRRRHGLVLDLPLTANISLANLPAVSQGGLIQRSAERRLAAQFIGQLRIKTASMDSEASTLSGGNQQKVALARWLATNPAVLILDEPTQGVDVGSKSEIHHLMADLAQRGLAILLISSDMPEILGMSDRIAVMHAGAIKATLSRQDATPQRILSLALGHDFP